MKIQLKVSSKHDGVYLFDHDGPVITIGRDPEADLTLKDSTVSWQHSRIELTNGTAVIRDLQSSNGTYVNAKPINQPKSLRLNSIVQLGKTGPSLKVKKLHSPAPPSPTPKPVPNIAPKTLPSPQKPQPAVAIPVAATGTSAPPAPVAVLATPRPTNPVNVRRSSLPWIISGALLFVALIAVAGGAYLAYQGSKKTPKIIQITTTDPEIKGTSSTELKSTSPPIQNTTKILTGEQIYDRVMQSSVLVVHLSPKKGNNFSTTMGSGAVISRNPNLILTNYHVVLNQPEMQVFFPEYNGKGDLIAERNYYQQAASSKQGTIGKVLATSKKADLALLRIDGPLPKRTKVLPISQRKVRSGQTVHSIGNPGASTGFWVYTSGSVRQIVPDANITSKGKGGSFRIQAKIIETQSPTNPGDSGGPLVNNYGELIGVTQGYNPKARSLSLFIHMDEVRDFLRGEGFNWTNGSKE